MLNREEKENLRNISVHEAGHHVMARAMGFKPGPITIALMYDGHKGGAEIVTTRGVRDVAEVRQYFEDRVVTLFGGAIAEALKDDKANENAANVILQTTATQDMTKIKELLLAIRNLRYPDDEDEAVTNKQLQGICDELWTKTVKLVEQYKPAISAIAGALAAKVVRLSFNYELTLDEINQLTAVKEAFP